jgi:hypothetical protein
MFCVKNSILWQTFLNCDSKLTRNKYTYLIEIYFGQDDFFYLSALFSGWTPISNVLLRNLTLFRNLRVANKEAFYQAKMMKIPNTVRVQYPHKFGYLTVVLAYNWILISGRHIFNIRTRYQIYLISWSDIKTNMEAIYSISERKSVRISAFSRYWVPGYRTLTVLELLHQT